jgi:hypothetical protein
VDEFPAFDLPATSLNNKTCSIRRPQIATKTTPINTMKVKFTGWSGESDTSNPHITVKTNEWNFEVDGKPYNWSIRKEEYFDGEGDGKGDGYWVHDNLANELKYDTTWKGWMDESNEGDNGERFEPEGWEIGELTGLEFIFNVNEFFESSEAGWSLFSFPDVGLGESSVLGMGEFAIPLES